MTRAKNLRNLLLRKRGRIGYNVLYKNTDVHEERIGVSV